MTKEEMTNEISVEEAIEVFKFMKRDVLEESKEDKVIDMAIKALEQQSSYNSVKTELDCISREDALKILCDKCPMYDCITGCGSYRAIEKMPSVTPQQKTGHWEDCSNGWMCSNCYKDVSHESDFCPHCGADMRGENIDE